MLMIVYVERDSSEDGSGRFGRKEIPPADMPARFVDLVVCLLCVVVVVAVVVGFYSGDYTHHCYH